MQLSTIGRLPEEYQHRLPLDSNKPQKVLTAIAIVLWVLQSQIQRMRLSQFHEPWNLGVTDWYKISRSTPTVNVVEGGRSFSGTSSSHRLVGPCLFCPMTSQAQISRVDVKLSYCACTVQPQSSSLSTIHDYGLVLVLKLLNYFFHEMSH